LLSSTRQQITTWATLGSDHRTVEITPAGWESGVWMQAMRSRPTALTACCTRGVLPFRRRPHAIEARGRDGPDEDGLRLRQTESKPVTAKINEWAMRRITEGPALPGTTLRDAIVLAAHDLELDRLGVEKADDGFGRGCGERSESACLPQRCANSSASDTPKGDPEPQPERVSDAGECLERYPRVVRVQEPIDNRPARAHGRGERGEGHALPIHGLANLIGEDLLLGQELDIVLDALLFEERLERRPDVLLHDFLRSVRCRARAISISRLGVACVFFMNPWSSTRLLPSTQKNTR
jgi:hypothetical protein